MSHVDEGRLHAYLDALERDAGAVEAWRDLERHVDECGPCRDRLEEARALRARAAGILGRSGPADATAPAFEEILARKRAQTTRRAVFRLNRLTALGWAATIVAAVGVGWIARGSLDPMDRDAVRAPGQEAVRPAPRTALGEEPAATETAPPAAASPRGEGVPPARSAPVAEGGRVAEAEDEALPLVLERAAEPAPAPVPTPTAPVAGAADLQQAVAGVSGAEPKVQPDTGVRPLAEERQARRAEAAPRAVALDDAGRGIEGIRAREQAVAAQAYDSWAPGLGPAVAIDWQGSTLEEAARHLGAPLLTVPDRDLLTVETAEIGGVPVVRMTYELEPGEPVEVSQWRRGEGVRELAPLEAHSITASTNLFRLPGTTLVLAAGEYRPGYQLQAVGRVAQERLRALLREVW